MELQIKRGVSWNTANKIYLIDISGGKEEYIGEIYGEKESISEGRQEEIANHIIECVNAKKRKQKQ